LYGRRRQPSEDLYTAPILLAHTDTTKIKGGGREKETKGDKTGVIDSTTHGF